MPERPYTILSCGMSLDGYLDAADHRRLVLSNEADLERVDAVRAECDAILVGAATVRNDNPRLLVRNEALRLQRRARGLRETPMKVTITEHADLICRIARGHPLSLRLAAEAEVAHIPIDEVGPRVVAALAGVTLIAAG